MNRVIQVIESTFLVIGTVLLIVACTPSSTVKNETYYKAADGSITMSSTQITGPKYPAGYSEYTNATSGEYISLPPAQSQKDIEKTIQDGKNKRWLYIGATILIILGGVGLGLPNNWVSNKDAAIVFLLGILAFAGLRYVEKSEKIMGVVLPIMIVASAGWFGYNHYKSKTSDVEPN